MYSLSGPAHMYLYCRSRFDASLVEPCLMAARSDELAPSAAMFTRRFYQMVFRHSTVTGWAKEGLVAEVFFSDYHDSEGAVEVFSMKTM